MNQPRKQTSGQDARNSPLQLAGGGKRGWQYDWGIWAIDSGLIATLQKSEPIVLWGLYRHANHEGHAWPSVRKLAAETGRGDRAVQLALRSLVKHERKFLTRRGKGFNGRVTATYIFMPFLPVSYQMEIDHTEAHEYAPIKRTDMRGGGAYSCAKSAQICALTQKNSEIELIVETRTSRCDDDEVLNSQSEQGSGADGSSGEPAGLFDSAEAAQALVDGFEWDPHDARRQVTKFGAVAVMRTVQKSEYFRTHGVPVGGKPVRNWRGFIVRDLSEGMPQDQRVLDAQMRTQRAEQAKRERERAEQSHKAQQAREEQDRAIMRMYMASVDQEQVRQQLISMHEQSNDTADQRIARSYSNMPLTNPILQAAIETYVMHNPSAAGKNTDPSGLDQ